MKKQNIVIGVAPTKRSFLSMEEAKRCRNVCVCALRGISGSRQPYGILEMIIKKLFIYSLPCFFRQEFRKASGFA